MLFSSASHKANTLLQRHASKMNGMTTVNTFIIKLHEGYALSKCFSCLYALWAYQSHPYKDNDWTLVLWHNYATVGQGL